MDGIDNFSPEKLINSLRTTREASRNMAFMAHEMSAWELVTTQVVVEQHIEALTLMREALIRQRYRNCALEYGDGRR